VSEYWASPEAWFTGRAVHAPGLPGTYPVDWLFSASGVAMDGPGLTTDGRLVHLAATGGTGWVTAQGAPTDPANGWAAGAPFWLAGGYWTSRNGAVTYPLATGGWSAGPGRRYVAARGVRFAPGPIAKVAPWRTVAVDPTLIPLGSQVYIPAYAGDGYGGWFLATDTGGGIIGRHVDVYRPPPAMASQTGRHLTGQRILVIAPHH
jgi:3D (Asp-Asp-Asp) domain-containing protein